MSEALAGYYTHSLPGTDRVIHLSLDAVDGILSEVMTGFGAIPRRGAEVGGLLLGRNEGQVTRIETFAMAPCEHRRGPSFLLSDRDREGLAGIVRAQQDGELAMVGMFRSNTRDSDAIADEDRTLFQEYFPPPSGVFLLIRPFASKTSIAAFLVYRDGELQESSTDVFPFQRRELEGGPEPLRRPLGERRRRPDYADDEKYRQNSGRGRTVAARCGDRDCRGSYATRNDALSPASPKPKQSHGMKPRGSIPTNTSAARAGSGSLYRSSFCFWVSCLDSRQP